MNSEQDAIDYINNNQCWNYNDIPVEFRTLSVNEHAIQKTLSVFGEHGLPLSAFPDYLKSKTICDIALESDVNNIEFIPSDQMTKDHANYALQIDFNLIKHIPGELHSQFLWSLSDQCDNIELSDVPGSFRTRELCLRFSVRNCRNLKHVPEYILDLKFYLDCLNAMPAIGNFLFDANDCLLEYVSDVRKNNDLCLAAVTNNPYNFEWVPLEIQSPAICRLFLEGVNRFDEPYVEDLLPKKIITPLLCRTAIDLDMTRTIRYNLDNEQLRFYAVEKNPMNLEFIDYENQNIHLCRNPFAKNPECAQFIDSKILNQLKK